jgi:ribosome-associated translation inhibitor RaiA
MNNREEFEKKLDPLKDKFAELDAHSIQLKEEENKLRATLMDAWTHYNEMLLEIEKRNEKVRSNFHYQANKNKDDFLKEAIDLKINFEQNAPFQASYTNENAFNILNEYNDIVKGLRARWNDMIFGF